MSKVVRFQRKTGPDATTNYTGKAYLWREARDRPWHLLCCHTDADKAQRVTLCTPDDDEIDAAATAMYFAWCAEHDVSPRYQLNDLGLS